MSTRKFVLSWVETEKSFTTWGQASLYERVFWIPNAIMCDMTTQKMRILMSMMTMTQLIRQLSSLDTGTYVNAKWACVDPEGVQGVRTPPEKITNYRGFCNTGPDPLKFSKFSKLPSQHIMAFHWRADDDPTLVIFESSLLWKKRKKNVVRELLSWTPSDKTFWSRA